MKLSKRGRAFVLASSVLPILGLVVFMGAPVVDGLTAFFFGYAAAAGLLVVSAVEFLAGLSLRLRLVCLDGAVRALLVLAWMSPLGLVASAVVPLGWSFAQTFNPAYACRTSACEDAVVDSISVAAMSMPVCYIELIRLADPSGGRAAAVRAMTRSSRETIDVDKYAAEVGLMSLGRGFYRAVRCEDWD